MLTTYIIKQPENSIEYDTLQVLFDGLQSAMKCSKSQNSLEYTSWFVLSAHCKYLMVEYQKRNKQ